MTARVPRGSEETDREREWRLADLPRFERAAGRRPQSKPESLVAGPASGCTANFLVGGWALASCLAGGRSKHAWLRGELRLGWSGPGPGRAWRSQWSSDYWYLYWRSLLAEDEGRIDWPGLAWNEYHIQ